MQHDLGFLYAFRGSIINFFFFFQAEDGIRDLTVTGVQTCALPISFEQCLSGAFNCPTPTMIRGERGSEGWSFVAEANGTQFEGTVSLDGRWIHVTRMLNKGSEP